MLYELSTLVATAGSTNRPVLQARDRDPLHQHQVKNDKKRCFTNGYDSQYLSHGLFTHLDWIGDLDHRTMADSNSTYTLDILTQTIRHTRIEVESSNSMFNLSVRQTNIRWNAIKRAEVRALEFSYLSPAM